ncbi:MAG: hypothetical protein A2312_03300 [Candidatus Staskawiczbacteria bacterium RIFOXYB2_FULL_32_9]|uniref:Uncharacterized protein n=1 Tax=Candidatus Staskawiczbacteria bacterium RIFOXYD1_FULL_32_13 TaxID=1802234 RepID=A0A1G2JM90_9BACT|nr:MAG: hypothetical protein UR22_C0029G0007 [Parcubacteria group bacterium GW2011_GWC2_32_10]OGZ78786.1 MAG: hypothetical protein A2360_00655 [Candidatus Staskawiczbacteria bacterium RIFOXYB1_FULL_32_11]OGZ83288.1 MAG: hypothetical protein A2312_03300 [Candidatus Staskawiczbacteria bacterium RIFOXYB2_FULL_32_9]OGZ87343.1 MAG: hypothetical protein A2463_01175 [Candidatus Staskawiczbacteria bacterium RIFOXYC2_FULL_32_10]OGZ88255.1 MAG: hypothetical protein A2561_04850 [Candidatus Staskawiczbacte
MIGENPSRDHVDDSEIRILSEEPNNVEVKILDNEKDINAHYDELKREAEAEIEKLFGAEVDDNSENTFVAYIRNANEKINGAEALGREPNLSPKEKQAILIRDKIAKNERERRDKIKALKSKQ